MTFKSIPVNKPELMGIYQRLGGEEALKRILRDFYSRMSNDILIGFFFEGKNTAEIADKQADFLMRAMGATASYKGKPPAQAHLEMAPILSGHFDRRLRILEETLKDHCLNVEDIRTWVTFENAFRSSIVRPEGPVNRE